MEEDTGGRFDMKRAWSFIIAGAILSAVLLAGITAAAVGSIQLSKNGDIVTLTGTTNLAVGDRLIVTVESAGFTPTEKGAGGGFGGGGGTVVVQPGSPLNSFSFDMDVSAFPPGDYLVMVESVETGYRESAEFVLPWTPVPTAIPSTPATVPATTGTTPAPTPTTVPATQASPRASPTRTPLPMILSVGALILATALLPLRR